jgi:hypothetical protein
MSVLLLEYKPRLKACTWCKQIYPEKDMIYRHALPACFFCDDKMTEYEEDAKRDAWERKHEPLRDEDNGREIEDDES